MTDTFLLENIIKNKGLKYSFIARQLNLSYQSLRNKMDNKSEFLPTEIEALCGVLDIVDLKIKNDIFFAKFVEHYST